jgi:hypothetical protein
MASFITILNGVFMKNFMLFLAFLSLTATAFANTDVTEECKEPARKILSAMTKKNVVVNSILEVGAGSFDVDHVIIFSEKNVGGVLYKASAISDSGECNFSDIAIETIY